MKRIQRKKNREFLTLSCFLQVLGKSVKPIPVMILGVIVAHKRYPLQKYLFVLMIVMGVAMFVYKDKKGSAVDADHTFGWGEALLVSISFYSGNTLISIFVSSKL